jgi:hypothetical protein
MTPQIAPEAAIPNPRLAAFAPLIGTWTTLGHHALIPNTTLHGRTSFEWLEGGAFLCMRSEIDEPRIPSGIAIIGSDDQAESCSMQYFDERGVSRRYEISMVGNVMRWWRDAPDISQRYTLTVSADGNALYANGEMSRDGGAWGPDLELMYTRVK